MASCGRLGQKWTAGQNDALRLLWYFCVERSRPLPPVQCVCLRVAALFVSFVSRSNIVIWPSKKCWGERESKVWALKCTASGLKNVEGEWLKGLIIVLHCFCWALRPDVTKISVQALGYLCETNSKKTAKARRRLM